MVPEGEKFKDISFPADASAISYKKDQNDFEWLRPTDVSSSPSLYGSEGINPGAVEQGNLGDCWMLAAIAALAEWPDRVEKIFGNQRSYPSDGKVDLNLFAMGGPVKVHIDDRLPGQGSGRQFTPNFLAKSGNGAWW